MLYPQKESNSDEELKSFVADERERDQRFYAERAAQSVNAERLADSNKNMDVDMVNTMPTSAYQHQFVQPVSSTVGNASDTGSQESIATACEKKLDLGTEYDPSNWFYEPGPNPVPYEMGRKVMNPFTDSLRQLQSSGDKQKLKQVVTRNKLIIVRILGNWFEFGIIYVRKI